MSQDWGARLLPAGRSVFCRLARTQHPPDAGCWRCAPKQLARTLSLDGKGHYFDCRFGIHNYWFPIRVRRVTVGIAYLQALASDPPRQSGSDGPTGASKVLNRIEFDRAGRLLRLIIQHVETLGLAELRTAELADARQAVTALEKELARLHEQLKRIIPAAAQPPPVFGPERHTPQVVQRLLERLHQDYRKPITLQECARKLRLNAAYLSALFSRTVGLPFKAYLTELRLQKARELLGDLDRNVCDVAAVVGYASENRFRLAFRKATGLSPRAWRETFRAAS